MSGFVPVIKSDRLVLRPFCLADAEDAYTNWASDPRVTYFLSWPPHASVEVTRSVIAGWMEGYGQGNFVWAIVEENTPVGSIDARRLGEGIYELGYCLAPSRWGRGLASEATRAVIDYLFSVPGTARVVACHEADNLASGRVLEKAGLMREETYNAPSHRDGAGVVVWHRCSIAR